MEPVILTTLLVLAGCNPPQSQEAETTNVDNMVNVTDPTHPDGEFWIDRFEYPNERGEKPKAYTSLAQAIEGCESKGKRLCTAYEWRRACLGASELRFSYGENYERNRCHTAGRLPSGHSSLMDPGTLIVESGAKATCTSDEGVFDMVGNLEEWVLDDWRGAGGMLEGGAWYTHTSYADCTGRYSRQPDYRIPTDRRVFSAGFRCCQSQTSPTAANLKAHAQSFVEQSNVHDPDVAYQTENEVELHPNHFIDRFEYPNVAGALPLAVSSWEHADRMCKDAGKRLCEAAEWENACSGETGWLYPYGNRYVPSACAVETDSRSPSGKYLGCIAPSGVQDMVGSVWEWTATPLDAPVLRVQGSSAIWYELRGGSWFSDSRKATCLPDDGYPAAPSQFTFAEVGFRCCRGENPTKIDTPQKTTLQCPEGMVGVDDFCIDRYEFPNKKGTPPLMDLSYSQSLEECRAVGKHLCTETEWGQACAGTGLRRWPYGNTYDVDACHDLGSQTEEGGGGTIPSGTMETCCTPEGICDMSGNLWEWTSTAKDSTTGIMRGGGWNLSAGLGQCRAKAKAQASFHAGETGARCCATLVEANRLLEGK